MSIPHEPSNAVSLDSVQQAFEHWRCSRAQRRVTPLPLREQAVLLMANHKRAHICKALRINDQALKQWAGQLAPAEHGGLDKHPARDSVAAGRFVELGSHTIQQADVANAKAATTVRIALVNGTVISTDQSFTLEQILLAASTSLEPST